MSENNNSIYNKALVFTVVALVVILIGTIEIGRASCRDRVSHQV